MRTIQEVSEQTLKLEAVFSSSPTGEFFTYEQLQELTQVAMDNRGKAFMRTALKRLKLPYETERGEGIKLLSKDNASRIVATKVIKIDNSVKRAEKTTKHIMSNAVFEELTESEKKGINFIGALFATIRSYSQSAKKIFYSKPLIVGEKVI